MFQRVDSWPMKECSDPLDGWDAKTIAETNSGPASADQHGKLVYYLRKILGEFHARVRNLNVSVQLFNLDVEDLPKRAKKASYARVEVSVNFPKYPP